MSGVLWLFDSTRPAQAGQVERLPLGRCGAALWPENGEEAAAFLSEGMCPACHCPLNADWIAWVPDQDELEVCIPYVPEGTAGWRGHRCDCCGAGWALVAKPRGFEGPTAVGVLPWGRWRLEYSTSPLHRYEYPDR